MRQPSGTVLWWMYMEEVCMARNCQGFSTLSVLAPPERRGLQRGKESSLPVAVAWMIFPRGLSDYLCSDGMHLKEPSDGWFSSSGSLMWKQGHALGKEPRITRASGSWNNIGEDYGSWSLIVVPPAVDEGPRQKLLRLTESLSHCVRETKLLTMT